jgi:hypothetical protein
MMINLIIIYYPIFEMHFHLFIANIDFYPSFIIIINIMI